MSINVNIDLQDMLNRNKTEILTQYARQRREENKSQVYENNPR